MNTDFYSYSALALQADGGAAPAGSPVAQGTGALMEMMSNMGGIALGVLVLLLIASLYSWTIILGKMSTFSKATRESRNFINAFRRATRLQEVAAFADNYKSSPLAQVYVDVYETYKRQTGGSGPPRT